MMEQNTEKKLTLEEWSKSYLKDYACFSLKPSTVEHYKDIFDKHINPFIGNIILTDLTPEIIQHLLNYQSLHGNLKTRGKLTPKSLRNMRTALSACFKQAVVNGLIGENPAAVTVILRTPRPEIQILDEESIRKLYKFLNTDANLMNIGIILAEELGLRRGEVCALTWADYDNGFLNIRRTVKRLKRSDKIGGKKTELVFGPVKTDKSHRSLVVSPYLQQVLSAQYERYKDMFGEPKPTDYIVFNASGGVTDPDNLTHYFSDVLQILDLPHVKFHALRHTLASRAIEMGIDVASVSGILGHGSVSTTTYYYVKPRQKGMNEALWKLSGNIGTAPSSLPSMVRKKTVHKTTRRSSI